MPEPARVPPWWRRGVVVAAIVALAGCGGGGGEGEDEPDTALLGPNPCRLVAKADLETALGAKLRAGADPGQVGTLPAIGVVGMKLCAYNPAQPGGPSAQVGVATDYPRQVFDKYKNAPINQPLVPVAGLGEEAVWFERNNTLVVLSGDQVFGVYLSVPGGSPQQDAARQVAEVMLAQQ